MPLTFWPKLKEVSANLRMARLELEEVFALFYIGPAPRRE